MQRTVLLYGSVVHRWSLTAQIQVVGFDAGIRNNRGAFCLVCVMLLQQFVSTNPETLFHRTYVIRLSVADKAFRNCFLPFQHRFAFRVHATRCRLSVILEIDLNCVALIETYFIVLHFSNSLVVQSITIERCFIAETI